MPPVHARAYLVEDARTGEVLAASNADERLPIASITKLMTVLLTLEHHKLTDVVTVDPRAAAVGESTVDLRSNERLTVARPLEGHAHPIGERRGRRTGTVGRARLRRVRGADEREGGGARPPQLALRPAGRARHAGRVLERRRRDEACTPRDAHALRARHGPREDCDDCRRARSAHVGRPALRVSAHDRRQDRPHRTPRAGARWRRCAPAASRSTRPCSAGRAARCGTPISSRCSPGGSRSSASSRSCSEIACTRPSSFPYGKAPLALRAAKPLNAVARVGRPLTERVVAAQAVSLPVREGQVLGRVEIWSGSRLVGHRDLVASRTINKPGVVRRLGWYAGRAGHNLLHFF